MLNLRIEIVQTILNWSNNKPFYTDKLVKKKNSAD